MNRILLSLFLAAVTIGVASAQTKVEIEDSQPVARVTGTVDAEVFDDVVLVTPDLAAKLGFEAGVKLWLTANPDFDVVDLVAERLDGSLSVFRNLGDNKWLISGEGDHRVEVLMIDFDSRRVERDRFQVVVPPLQFDDDDDDGDDDDGDDDDGDDDDGQPDPDNTLKAKWMIILEETQDRANHPEKTAVMTSQKVWETAQSKGVEVRLYDDDMPSISKWAKLTNDRPVFILIEDAWTYQIYNVPDDAQEMIDTINKVVR